MMSFSSCTKMELQSEVKDQGLGTPAWSAGPDGWVRIWCKHDKRSNLHCISRSGWRRWVSGYQSSQSTQVLLQTDHSWTTFSSWITLHDFRELPWSPKSPDLLWDVVEQEITTTDVQPTNLQQVCDHTISTWTRTPEEWFRMVVGSMPLRNTAPPKVPAVYTK